MIDINNNWQIAQLIAALETCRELNNWHDVQEEINRRFDQLIISTDIMDALMATPYSGYAASRMFILLGILNTLVIETDDHGVLSRAGTELHEKHFVGEKAWFSVESPKDKQVMTFSDPIDTGSPLYCPYHGKIKSPQLRIHFEWPRPSGQHEIKVVYIGPKITKG